MRNRLLVCCISFLAMDCSKNISESFVFENHTPKIIDVIEPRMSTEAVVFKELLDQVVYVPLETNEQALLASCGKILVDNDRFVILDREYSSVNVFDRGGKHLFKIGGIGSGPGEFLGLDDMGLDTVNHQLLLWSNGNKSFYKYNLADGKFIEQVRMPFYGSYFYLLGDDYIFYMNYNSADGRDAQNLFVSDKKGNIKHSYFSFSAKKFIASIPFSGFLSKNDDGYLYAHALSDTVYQVSNDLRIAPKYIFDLGEKTWTRHFGISDHQEYMTRGTEYSVLFSPVFEWKGYCFFLFQHDRYIKKGLIRLEKNEVYTSDDFEGDIEFELFNIPVGRNASSLISVLYPDKVYRLREKYPDFDERVAENPPLKAVIDKLQLNDNPVLMIYTMKR